MTLERDRAWMEDGTKFFQEQVDGLTDEAFAEPSRLAGWTRGHVVSHLARNGDALGNLLSWARTGDESPMYPSVEARAAGIEESAAQRPAELRADLAASTRRLADAVATMPPEAWQEEIRSALGRRLQGSGVPWMRVREVWVHAVDLGTGASFEDFPPALVDAFLEEAVGGFRPRDDCPAVRLVAGERSWRIGPLDAAAVAVHGPPSALLAWLLGRSDDGVGVQPETEPLPDLPPWL